MKYTTYIFDFDYTLADATLGIVDSINYALLKMNRLEADYENIRKTIGMHLTDAYTFLTEDSDQEHRLQFFNYFKEKADLIMLENTKLYQDTIDVLTALKSNGFQIGIVSTKSRYRISEVLSKYKITHLIDIIVGGEDVENNKPHPEPLLKAITQLNVNALNVIYIGDSIIDAQTAHDANVDFIGITTGTTSKEHFSQYPFVSIIKTLSELLDIH